MGFFKGWIKSDKLGFSSFVISCLLVVNLLSTKSYAFAAIFASSALASILERLKKYIKTKDSIKLISIFHVLEFAFMIMAFVLLLLGKHYILMSLCAISFLAKIADFVDFLKKKS